MENKNLLLTRLKSPIFLVIQILIVIFGYFIALVTPGNLFPVLWILALLASSIFTILFNSKMGRESNINAYKKSAHQRYWLLIFLGIVTAVAAAAVDISTVRNGGLSMLLIGVPYFLPIGSLVMGVFAVSGYLLILSRQGALPSRDDLFVAISISILCLVLNYIFLYFASSSLSFKDFAGSYMVHGPYLLLHRKALYAGSESARWPLATPLLEFSGIILGAIFAWIWARSKVRA